MPRLNGFEVLSWIRDHPECAVIPVIMMSSSRDERDITKAYQLGANSYMTKPGRLEDFIEMFQALKTYWRICELPHLPLKS